MISKIKAGLIIRHIRDASRPNIDAPDKNKLNMICWFNLLAKPLPFSLKKLSSPMHVYYTDMGD